MGRPSSSGGMEAIERQWRGGLRVVRGMYSRTGWWWTSVGREMHWGSEMRPTKSEREREVMGNGVGKKWL
jgi:hypothetical protein